MKNKFKPFVGASTDELFIYFLLISEFKDDLFIPGNGGHFMPDYNEEEYYKLPPMIMRDMGLKPVHRDGKHILTHNSYWDFLREMWKGYSHEEIYEVAKTVSERWGELQIKKGSHK